MSEHPPDGSSDAATVDAVKSASDRVDVHAIAERLGVALKSVHVWKSTRRIMPPPEGQDLDGGDVWEWETILRWAGDTGRLRTLALIEDYRRLTGKDPVPPRAGGPVSAEVKERLRAG